jgi:glutamyl-Q tRNA(Asp) synthetase
MPDQHPYRGRFAPSPTGPLHFGSIITAVASYADARAQQGEWLLRIEDVDAPRTVPGSADDILRTLEALGFEWSGEVLYQTQRLAAYQAALQQLQQQDLVYRCTCTRSELQMLSPHGIYPGLCADKHHAEHSEHAVRLRVPDKRFALTDYVMRHYEQNLQNDVGDFVIRRRDGLFAYQLAVVVDDAYQGITHIVRGADLLDSTPRQMYLQQCLGYPATQYMHLPLAINLDGEKLSKQTYAPHIKTDSAILFDTLNFLGQQVPAELAHESCDAIWQWSITNWQREKIPKNNQRPPKDYIIPV